MQTKLWQQNSKFIKENYIFVIIYIYLVLQSYYILYYLYLLFQLFIVHYLYSYVFFVVFIICLLTKAYETQVFSIFNKKMVLAIFIWFNNHYIYNFYLLFQLFIGHYLDFYVLFVVYPCLQTRASKTQVFSIFYKNIFLNTKSIKEIHFPFFFPF